MDKIIRGILNDGKIRIFLADTSKSCEKICAAHNLGSAASDALSRVCSIAAIMGIMQKNGRLTVKIDANGPLKSIVVDADCEGNIRGYVARPNIDETITKVEEAIGDLGIITVIKDLGMKRNFSSQIELQSGKIGEDFSYYFKESEQVPSVVATGTHITINEFISGALIVQLMPGYQEEDLLYAENFAAQCPPVSDMLKIGDLEQVLSELFPEIKILSTSPVKFACNCSKGRFIAGVATLPVEDIQEMIVDNQDVELCCNFCNTKYILTMEDLQYALKLKTMNTH